MNDEQLRKKALEWVGSSGRTDATGLYHFIKTYFGNFVNEAEVSPKRLCECELRNRQWDGYKCRTCGRNYAT